MAEHKGETGAPMVVFVHGSLDRSSAFLKVQRHLRDLHVVRYDRRGYAKSIALGAATSFEVQVTDLAAVVDGRPAVICGHSLGGVIALALAERAPDLVRAVVAFESPMPWTSWWPKATAGSAAIAGSDDEGAAERFMRRLIGDDRWDELPEATRAQRRAEGPALLADLRSLREPEPQPYRPEALQIPVVAAHGTESAPHHQETARRLAGLVPGAELAVIAGAGHGAHLSHPAELAALVRRAIERAADTVQ